MVLSGLAASGAAGRTAGQPDDLAHLRPSSAGTGGILAGDESSLYLDRSALARTPTMAAAPQATSNAFGGQRWARAGGGGSHGTAGRVTGGGSAGGSEPVVGLGVSASRGPRARGDRRRSEPRTNTLMATGAPTSSTTPTRRKTYEAAVKLPISDPPLKKRCDAPRVPWRPGGCRGSSDMQIDSRSEPMPSRLPASPAGD